MCPTLPERSSTEPPLPVDLAAILAARERIGEYIRPTPVRQAAGDRLWLKCENRQTTGSFKLRGALNRVLSLDEEEARQGVLAASAGNHGQGVAYAARLRGLRATIVVSEHAVAEKVAGMRSLGAEVILVPGGFPEAEAAGLAMAKARGLTWISPYNDPAVVAGQATIGLELAEQLPLADSQQDWRVFVPASGGGLVCGIGLALKSLAPEVRVIAVQPRACPFLYTHLRGGDMAAVVETDTIADGLSGAVEKGSITLEMLPRVVDEAVLVDEGEIEAAMRWSARVAQETIEPSAAVAVAAARREESRGHESVALLSGGNVSAALLARVLAEG